MGAPAVGGGAIEGIEKDGICSGRTPAAGGVNFWARSASGISRLYSGGRVPVEGPTSSDGYGSNCSAL
jgi:hypothetical protein